MRPAAAIGQRGLRELCFLPYGVPRSADRAYDQEAIVKKSPFYIVLALVLALPAGAQVLSFGLGDTALEASLNDIGASAKIDLPGFTAEVSLQWGTPQAQVQTVLSQGYQPAEVYLVAALANLSGKPVALVVETYSKNKAKGWGFVAKELGIKPGSKEFKALKDKSVGSAAKGKAKKKK
jgi:hypothetical protein